ncbi:gamma-glutamylcyclotransferase [Vibrio sp. DW001]|uniref:gamma-glutamylcyclotransferase family protein n=1 Tax=Vibrio sp. DW001 TaxID=2912315 RepID=UPI0023AEFCF0|nr:gamma-glutamylcyclotransferase [Vibrio sp. DW001]WED26992.1 gamma-glutamylcyclotransferase [Vibrio sp. DW001]
MRHLVFVYGTLRKGESNHHVLSDSEYLGFFETEPNYQLFNYGSYPGVTQGNCKVLGEVYSVDDDVLQRLDRLENVPIDYRRDPIDTPYGSAWIYLYQEVSPLDEAITSGNWLYRNK